MGELLREMCMLSVLAGVLMAITPDGAVRRVSEICACAMLTAVLLSALGETDFDKYALDSAKLFASERELSKGAEKAQRELNRLVIEREYRTYICDKAKAFGIEDIDILLEVRWDMDGIWVPWSVEVHTQAGETETDALKKVIRDELGIPFERQSWNR